MNSVRVLVSNNTVSIRTYGVAQTSFCKSQSTSLEPVGLHIARAGLGHVDHLPFWQPLLVARGPRPAPQTAPAFSRGQGGI